MRFSLLQNRPWFQDICPGCLWTRDNRWLLSRVQRQAGPAGRQRSFIPVVDTNRNKKGAFCLGWWLQPRQKTPWPFCPGWSHHPGQKGAFYPGWSQHPGQKATDVSPCRSIFSKSLAPLSSHFSPSPLSLPYLLPPAPFLSCLLSSLPPALSSLPGAGGAGEPQLGRGQAPAAGTSSCR